MCWNRLQERAQQMGFEVALRTQRDAGGGFMPDLTPPGGNGWLLVGNYEHVAGFWVKPLSDNASKLNGAAVRRLMAEVDPFVEAVGDYDADFFAANEPFLAALQYLESSRE